jgi:hypothetical protein
MFLVLWEFEVKPGNEERFEQVYGPDAVTGIPSFAAIQTMQELDCSRTRRGPVCISLPTTGSPENPTRNSLLFGEANTKH